MSIRSEFVRLWNEFMANAKKISELPAATTPLAGTEETEINQGGVSKRVAVSNFTSGGAAVKVIQVAFSDTTTAITAGTAKVTFRMPYAMTVTSVRASLGTTQASGNIFTVDINEGGTTILSTKITIDNGEKTSTTAAIPPVISDAALADDAEMTIDVDQVGNGTAIQGIVTLIGS